MRKLYPELVGIFCLLLAPCIPLCADDDLFPESGSPDSTEALQKLIDVQDEEEIGSWWNAFDGEPVLASLIASREPVTAFVRSRIVDPDRSSFPAQDLRGEISRGEVWFGLRLQRDRGEPNGTDLSKMALRLHTYSVTLVAGDFRVNRGLGWTVGTTPHFPSASDPSAPLRKTGQAIQPQLSSEEGWGWRGAAISVVPRPLKSPEIHFWSGSATYDARPDGDTWILYAFQGEHDNTSEVQKRQIGETVLGASASVPLSCIRLDATRFTSHFNAPFSDKQSSRFRFAEETFGASGVSLHFTLSKTSSLEAEITRQDQGAWGGGVVFALPVDGNSQLVLAGWRATSDFAPLHSRPWMATGSDPAGHSGIQLGWQRKLLCSTLLAVTGMGELVEGTNQEPEESRVRILVSIEHRFTRAMTCLLRGAWLRSWQGPITLTASRRLLIQFRKRVRSGTMSLRLRGSLGQKGNAWGSTISGERNLIRRVALALAGTYFSTAGTGERAILYEPSLAGEFPMRSLSGREICMSARLRVILPEGVIVSLRARAGHSLKAAVINSSSQSWALGISWRPSPTNERGTR